MLLMKMFADMENVKIFLDLFNVIVMMVILSRVSLELTIKDPCSRIFKEFQ